MHDSSLDNATPLERHPAKVRLVERFDLIAGGAIAVLVIAILITVAAGDHAGVAITATSPLGSAHATSPIRIIFAEAMDTASVESRFSIDPPIKGTFSWSNTQLTFTPDSAFKGGQHYTLTVQAGALSQQGRSLTQAVHWEFETVPARVLYLSPAVRDEESNAVPNLWMVDPAVPFASTQLTFSHLGILPDYTVSPDGTRIAYAENGEGGTSDLYIYTLSVTDSKQNGTGNGAENGTESGTIQRVTQCVQAQCQAPEWSPDGTRLVYERTELNPALPDNDRGVPRAWVVNLADLSTAPLLSSSQMLGKAPRWSPNGSEITVYDSAAHDIIIYNIVTGDRKIIPSQETDSGTFDPKGNRLIFAELQQSQEGFYTTLSIADLANQQNGLKPIKSKDDAPAEDRGAAWQPDGSMLAITRRYFGVTPGAQVYLVDPKTDAEQPLVVDPTYNHGAVSWNPSGDQLLMQRFPLFGDNPMPGIWVYDMQTKALTQIGKNGFLPKWLP